MNEKLVYMDIEVGENEHGEIMARVWKRLRLGQNEHNTYEDFPLDELEHQQEKQREMLTSLVKERDVLLIEETNANIELHKA